jgi:hypothetical protein
MLWRPNISKSLFHQFQILSPFSFQFSFTIHQPNPRKSVRKSKRKQKNETLLRCITTSLFLRNYFPSPKRNAKSYKQQIFLQNTMEPRILYLFNCVLYKKKKKKKKNQNTFIFSYYSKRLKEICNFKIKKVSEKAMKIKEILLSFY